MGPLIESLNDSDEGIYGSDKKYVRQWEPSFVREDLTSTRTSSDNSVIYVECAFGNQDQQSENRLLDRFDVDNNW